MTTDVSEIRFYPVCAKCGKVLWGEDVNVEIIYYEAAPENIMFDCCKFPDYQLVPGKCPYCQTKFDAVYMPTKLPFKTPTRPMGCSDGN